MVILKTSHRIITTHILLALCARYMELQKALILDLPEEIIDYDYVLGVFLLS